MAQNKITLDSFLKLKPTTEIVDLEVPSLESDYTKTQIGQLIKSDVGQKNYFPNWMGGQLKKSSNFKNLAQFYSNVIGATPQQKIDLGKVNPSLLQYDAVNDVFKGPLGRDINGFTSRLKNRDKQILKARQKAKLSLTQQQINQNIPAIVRQIVGDNKIFSKYGIGPINSKKFPLYAGRWLDPISGQLRILPKASNKYLNPASYTQHKQYLQARILNKWNQFVGVIQQYTNLSLKDKTKWQNQQIKKISTKFQKQKQVIGFPSRITTQYKKYVLKFPMANGGKIYWDFISKLPGYQKLQQTIKNCVQAYQTNTVSQQTKKQKKDSSIAVIQAMNGLLAQFIKSASKQLTPAQYSSSLSYGYNMASNKIKQIRNTLLKISKIMNIPQNLSQLQVQTLQKTLQQDKKRISQILGQKKSLQMQNVKDIKIGTGKLQDILKKAVNSSQNYIKSNLPQFKPLKSQPQSWSGISFGSLRTLPLNLSYQGSGINQLGLLGQPQQQNDVSAPLINQNQLQQLANAFDYGKAKKENYIGQVQKALSSLTTKQAQNLISKINTGGGTIAQKINNLQNQAKTMVSIR